MKYARPGPDTYYLGIAEAVAVRSNCLRRQVGALIVVENRIVSTGYNGTPAGLPNCFDGGCARCSSTSEQGASYESCICVHAEENAIYLAARHGTRVEGGVLYCTLRPCSGCLKGAIQAGISRCVFGEDWTDEQRRNLMTPDYEVLVHRLRGGVIGA